MIMIGSLSVYTYMQHITEDAIRSVGIVSALEYRRVGRYITLLKALYFTQHVHIYICMCVVV